jgi:CNT family concentrative nucleoside transporter
MILSTDRRRVRWRVVTGGIGLQVLLALLVLRVPLAQDFFNAMAAAATRILSFTDAGAEFIFGYSLYTERSLGFVFAFHILPTIIFFASFMAVLYHLGVMQIVVQGLARVMNRAMGVSGAESLAVAANVFVGQTEAPLVVRPYVSSMTRSELMTLMVGGFATIAGGVFAAYVAMLGGDDPAQRVEFAKHLLTASVMSAPAAFVVSKIMVPETQASETAGVVKAKFRKTTINVLDAATSGASDGLRLAANVGAMLLALLALIAAVDYVLGWIGSWPVLDTALQRASLEPLNLKNLLGLLFSPLAWVMGVPLEDVRTLGSLLGEKVVLTEFVAYSSLGEIMQSDTPMQSRSQIIAAYALCGFANFGSIAIQLGGIGGIAPDRRQDLARLGLRAMIGGALASFMTATIAGILL